MFLWVFVWLLFAFAIFFWVARKATVNGFVVPVKGINRVLSPQSGTVAKLNVSEGQEVRIGDPLFIISSERSAENGAVQAAVKESLVARIEKLRRELDQVGGQSSNKQRELADKLASVNASLKQLDHELALRVIDVREVDVLALGHRLVEHDADRLLLRFVIHCERLNGAGADVNSAVTWRARGATGRR